MQIYFVFAADYVGIGRKYKECADRIRAKQRRSVEMDCAHGIRTADWTLRHFSFSKYKNACAFLYFERRGGSGGIMNYEL